MKNMKDRYFINYNKPHNTTITLWQNQVRNIATKAVWGKEEAEAAIRDLVAKGFVILSVRNGIGKNITITL